MKTATTIAVLALVCMIVTCAPAATPTPLPSPVPSATATPFPTFVPTPEGDFVPTDIPRCQGLKALDKPLKFTWANTEDLKTDTGDWFYYHCNEKADDLAAFYRAKMTKPPCNWLETGWVAQPGEGTVGIYFHTARQIWSYTWFLPDASSNAGSYLVISQQYETIIELGCCK